MPKKTIREERRQRERREPAVRKIPLSVLTHSDPDGMMSPDQLEGSLWAYFYLLSRSMDRRGNAEQVGELPKGARELDQETGEWHNVGGEAVYASPAINRVSGLPESSASLMPIHRAIMGVELALCAIIPPEDFCASLIYTDDLPPEIALTDEQKARGGIALCFKCKYQVGPNGQPMAAHHCRACGFEWVGETMPRNFCLQCKAEGNGRMFCLLDNKPIVTVGIIDAWSMEEILAVKNNARTLKRVVHQLAEKGFFRTKPQIDEVAGELGTTELVHGEDGYTMGFQITESGLQYATKWARAHPKFLEGQHDTLTCLLKAMGPLAERAPEWAKARVRQGDPARIAGGPAKTGLIVGGST